MRSILITAAVLATLVIAFTVFLLTQRSSIPVAKRNRGTPASLPAPKADTPSGSSFGAGESGWVQSFDKKSGELVNEFRADHFDPPVDNQVHVIRPDARFYGRDGSVLTLRAVYGDFTMAEAAHKTERLGAMQSQPPSHGILHDVILGLLETPQSTVPVITCKLPIVAFDNDLLRLDSVPLPVKGQPDLPADRIPVTVRGRDYDFDGEGLTVRYNQRDRRLEFLEVAHGQRLLIKNPNAFGGAATRPATPPMTPLSMRPAPDPEIDLLSQDSARVAGPLQRPCSGSERFPAANRAAEAAPPSADDLFPWNHALAPALTIAGRPIELASADAADAPKLTAEERERRRQKRLATTRRAAHDARAQHLPATKPASTRPHEVVAYRATFNDSVRIKEGPADVGDADVMTATFTFDQENKSTTKPSTRPGATPDGSPAVRPTAGPAASPATRPARRTHAAPAAPTATVQPTTRRARRGLATNSPAGPASAPSPTGPIEIKWTGKLTVVPQKLADSGLRSTADRIVEFNGKPTHLKREGSTVTADYVWAAVEGNRFRAAPGKTTPNVVLTDPSGTVVTTESIDADGDDAILHGRSSAKMVMGQGDEAKTLLTTWTDFATLRLVTAPDGHRGIERANFRGHVDVTHPQLKMTSDTLALGFVPDPAKQQSQLSTVRADGTVAAAVTGDDGAVQHINAATLDLATAPGPNGQMAVRALHAHGDVVTTQVQDDVTQTLKTDELATTLAPAPASDDTGATTQPTSFVVDHLSATGRVQFSKTDGSSASGDRLEVERVGGAQWVTLYGTPAHAGDAQTQASGDVIRADASGAHATIDGPGTLRGQSKPTDDGKPTQPIDVSWTKSLVYDGQTNAAKILGDVVVTSRSADGTLSTADCKQVDVAFADAPATQPAATPAAPPSTKPSTKPSTRPSIGLGGFAGGGNKQVKSLTLSDGKLGNVEINSQLYAVDDATRLVRRTYLEAPAVIVYTNPDGSPGAMDVPSAGRMLYQDIPPATQPAAAPTPTPTPPPAPKPPAASQPAGPGGRGTVAIEWKKRMHYDPVAKQVILEGDCVVKHRNPGEEPVEMIAPRLVGDVTGGGAGQGAQLKKMTADQGATLLGRQMRIDAAKAVYEPLNDRVIATGTPRQPVQFFDEKGGLTRGSIGEMWWNLKTNQPEKVIDVSVEVNR